MARSSLHGLLGLHTRYYPPVLSEEFVDEEFVGEEFVDETATDDENGTAVLRKQLGVALVLRSYPHTYTYTYTYTYTHTA